MRCIFFVIVTHYGLEDAKESELHMKSIESDSVEQKFI